MTDDSELIQQQIETNILGGPHVVILGAGATCDISP